MIARNYGESTTLECRHDSHERVDAKKRQKEILSILKETNEPLTAMEIAEKLYLKKLVKRVDRNYASPRLTELSVKGEVEPVGKKVCKYTGRMVTAYQIRENE